MIYKSSSFRIASYSQILVRMLSIFLGLPQAPLPLVSFFSHLALKVILKLEDIYVGYLPGVIQRTNSYGQKGDRFDWQLRHRCDYRVRLPTLISVVDDYDRSDGA